MAEVRTGLRIKPGSDAHWILRALADGPKWPLPIVTWIEDERGGWLMATGTVLRWTDELEQHRFVTATYEYVPKVNERRYVYRLTVDGEQLLAHLDQLPIVPPSWYAYWWPRLLWLVVLGGLIRSCAALAGRG